VSEGADIFGEQSVEWDKDGESTLVFSKARRYTSWGLAVDQHGNVFRLRENYLANGRVDLSRSHYTRNGRKVTGKAWRKMFGRSPHG